MKVDRNIVLGLPICKHNDITVSVEKSERLSSHLQVHFGWAGRSVAKDYDDWGMGNGWYPVDFPAYDSGYDFLGDGEEVSFVDDGFA